MVFDVFARWKARQASFTEKFIKITIHKKYIYTCFTIWGIFGNCDINIFSYYCINLSDSPFYAVIQQLSLFRVHVFRKYPDAHGVLGSGYSLVARSPAYFARCRHKLHVVEKIIRI